MRNGVEIKDKSDISNKFNEYFATIGPKLAAEIINTENKSYKSYLNNKTNFSSSLYQLSMLKIFLKPLNQNQALGMTHSRWPY